MSNFRFPVTQRASAAQKVLSTGGLAPGGFVPGGCGGCERTGGRYSKTHSEYDFAPANFSNSFGKFACLSGSSVLALATPEIPPPAWISLHSRFSPWLIGSG